MKFALPKAPEDLEKGVVEGHMCVQQVTAIDDESIGEAFAEGKRGGKSAQTSQKAERMGLSYI